MIVRLVWVILPLVIFSIVGISESFAQYTRNEPIPMAFPYSFYEINSNGTYYFSFSYAFYPESLEVRNFDDKTTLFYTESFPNDTRNIIIKFPSDTPIGKKEIIVHANDEITLTKPPTFFYPSIFSTSPHEIIADTSEPNSMTVIDGDITITLSTDKMEYLEDEIINISWQIENQGEEKIFYQPGGSGCHLELGIIVVGNNNSYFHGQLQPKRVNFDQLICSAVYIEPVVPPNSIIKNEFSWNQYVSVSRTNIEKIPVGKYILEVSYFDSEEQYFSQQGKNVQLPIIVGDIKHLSPQKQIKVGILPEDITCREGLELIFKSSDHSPACVKPETAEKLVKRGWANEN